MRLIGVIDGVYEIRSSSLWEKKLMLHGYIDVEMQKEGVIHNTFTACPYASWLRLAFCRYLYASSFPTYPDQMPRRTVQSMLL